MTIKILDAQGVAHLWAKIKAYVDSKTAAAGGGQHKVLAFDIQEQPDGMYMTDGYFNSRYTELGTGDTVELLAHTAADPGSVASRTTHVVVHAEEGVLTLFGLDGIAGYVLTTLTTDNAVIFDRVPACITGQLAMLRSDMESLAADIDTRFQQVQENINANAEIITDLDSKKQDKERGFAVSLDQDFEKVPDHGEFVYDVTDGSLSSGIAEVLRGVLHRDTVDFNCNLGDLELRVIDTNGDFVTCIDSGNSDDPGWHLWRFALGAEDSSSYRAVRIDLLRQP